MWVDKISSAPNIEINIVIRLLLWGSILFLFFTSQALKLLVNPASLVNKPRSDDSMDLVDKNSTRSIALFSIVLVVIQFTLRNTTVDNIKYWEDLAINSLLIAAVFLVFTFVLEMWPIKNYIFNLQLTSLRFSGLLLFQGLYFLLRSESINSLFSDFFAIFIIMSWALWSLHELDYIYNIQMREWNNSDFQSRFDCFKTAILKFRVRMKFWQI